jgi:hydroxyacylglutathione hydrolase
MPIHGKGDFRMKLTSIPLKYTNCYLVRAGEKYLLVDTGYEYEWGLFRRRLRETGVELGEIGFILLTHHHDDHSGLLHAITAANPEAKVILTATGREILAGGKHVHGPDAGYINRRIGWMLSLKGKLDKGWTHTFPPYHTRPNDVLLSGETNLRDIGIPLDGCILATPGHSPDHVSVVFDDGDCLAGDAAANFLQRAGAKHCVISVDDLDEYYASWRKILSAGARRIFPGHGRPFDAEELRRNIGRQRKECMVLFSKTQSIELLKKESERK